MSYPYWPNQNGTIQLLGLSTNVLSIIPGNSVVLPGVGPNPEFSTIYGSTMTTTELRIDSQTLNADATNLFLNGQPIATLANISSLNEWAYEPAISSINVQNNDIYSTNRIFANTGIFNNISTTTLTAFSTIHVVSTISSSVFEAGQGTFSTLNTGLLWGQPSSFYQATPIPSSLTLSNVNVSSIQGTPDVTIVSDPGVAANVPEISMIARNGTGGKVSILADTGAGGTSFGAVEITANGGTTSGIGTGGSITLTANSPAGTASNLTSKISLVAAGINNYAGAISPVGSLTGHLINYGSLAIQNYVGIPPTLPNFPGSIYSYAPGGAGYGGIRLESPTGVELVDNTDLYAYRIYPYYNPFFIGTYPDLVITGRSNVVGNNQYLQLSSIRGVEFGFNEVKGYINGLSSINGQPLSYYEPQPATSSFTNLYTQNLAASTINTTDGALTGISSINGQPLSFYEPGGVSTLSTFTDLTTSTINIKGGSSYLYPTADIQLGEPGNTYGGLFTNGTDPYLNMNGTNSKVEVPNTYTDTLQAYQDTQITLNNNMDVTSGGQINWPSGNTSLQENNIQTGRVTATEVRAVLVYGNAADAQIENFSSIQGTDGVFSNLTATNVYLSPSTLIQSETGFSQLNVVNPTTLSTAQILGSAFVAKANPTDANFGAYSRDINNNPIYINSNFSTNQLMFNGQADGTISSLTTSSINGVSYAPTQNWANFPAATNVNMSNFNITNIDTTTTANLNANVISSLQATTSSLTFRGAGAFSSILYNSTHTTVGQASTMLYLDSASDFSVGNNDVFSGQLRIGFNQPSGAAGLNRRAEIVIYNQQKSEYHLSAQSNDISLRYATSYSTLTTTFDSYLLDTSINFPRFSTIDNQVNLMAFFPSSINGNIGLSTISKMNPVTLYGNSTLSGGALTVVFTPPYLDSNEYAVNATYKDTAGGNPLHVSINSISSFTVNGNAGNSFFWTAVGRV